MSLAISGEIELEESNKPKKGGKNSLIQSRIDVLQKTLKFKAYNHRSPNCPPKANRNAQISPHLKSNAIQCSNGTNNTNNTGQSSTGRRPDQANNTMLDRYSNIRVRRTTTVVGKITPYGRNIRKELAQNKFSGLARLFRGKQAKMEISGDVCPRGGHAKGFVEDKKELENSTDGQSGMLNSTDYVPRLPSPWLTRDSLIVPERKQTPVTTNTEPNVSNSVSAARHMKHKPKPVNLKFDESNITDRIEKSKSKKKKQSASKLNVHNENTINNEVLTDSSLMEEEDSSDDRSEVYSRSFGSALEDISTKVLLLEQQQQLCQKISLLLIEFFSNLQVRYKSKQFARQVESYISEIVFANKCLLVASETKSLLEHEINQLQHRRSMQSIATAQQTEPMVRINLTVRSVTIPLRRRSSNTFLFCLLKMSSGGKQQTTKLAESNICNTLTHSSKVVTAQATKQSKPFVRFDLNEVFEDLEPNFELMMQFYQMQVPLREDEHHCSLYRSLYDQLMGQLNRMQVVKYVKRVLFNKQSTKKKSTKKNGTRSLMPLFDEANLKAASTSAANLSRIRIVGTSFKLIGSVAVNRSNIQIVEPSLDQFDYCWAATENRAILDLVMSI